MSLQSTLKFITTHPLNKDNKLGAVKRFINWQVFSRLNPWSVIYPLTDRSKIIVKKGMAGATGNLYCGLHEYHDMFFLLHFLRSTDLFLDIGANIGSYTILASGHCSATTVAFEPAPSTYSSLLDNVAINRMGDKVTALNLAVGASNGQILFTSSLDTINHVATKASANTITVEVKRLDDIIGERNPQLIKIDVEGYESEVLAGGTGVLGKESLKAIIIELNGAGANYGFDESKIHELLLAARFLPFQYHPENRSLEQLPTYGKTNTIYIRDLEYVKQRLIEAEKVNILGKSI